MLYLKREHLERMRGHGRRVYPYECCGFLVGRMDGGERRVVEVRAAGNEKAAQEASRRFWISPENYFQLELRARKAGLEILGVYHSHPDHPGEPSEFDREHALPGWSYIVFSVRREGPGRIGSWLLAEDRSRFRPEAIQLLDGSQAPAPEHDSGD
ncbi:MAG: hypothetical protein GF355_06440 [Candidatus Eisenbacteria bacterium]|nr:hypothetical protein [Candidatus Eisenbacteria bacterium]